MRGIAREEREGGERGSSRKRLLDENRAEEVEWVSRKWMEWESGWGWLESILIKYLDEKQREQKEWVGRESGWRFENFFLKFVA